MPDDPNAPYRAAARALLAPYAPPNLDELLAMQGGTEPAPIPFKLPDGRMITAAFYKAISWAPSLNVLFMREYQDTPVPPEVLIALAHLMGRGSFVCRHGGFDKNGQPT